MLFEHLNWRAPAQQGELQAQLQGLEGRQGLDDEREDEGPLGPGHGRVHEAHNRRVG